MLLARGLNLLLCERLAFILIEIVCTLEAEYETLKV